MDNERCFEGDSAEGSWRRWWKEKEREEEKKKDKLHDSERPAMGGAASRVYDTAGQFPQ